MTPRPSTQSASVTLGMPHPCNVLRELELNPAPQLALQNLLIAPQKARAEPPRWASSVMGRPAGFVDFSDEL